MSESWAKVIEDHTAQATQEVKKVALDGRRAEAEALRSEFAAGARVATGAERAGWRVEEQGDESAVVNDVEHWVFGEFGTRKEPARPNVRPVTTQHEHTWPDRLAGAINTVLRKFTG